jgi:hypothetical protein
MQKITAAITSVGGYVPEYRLTNAILETMIDTNDEWIKTRTGVEERRILKGEGLATSDMCVPAVLELCKKRGIQPEEIDCLIVATVTPDMIFPATANIVCDKSGNNGITTAPPASSSASLVVGTAYQNTLGYDVIVTVYFAVSAATSADINLGVGPTTTPGQQIIVTGLTLAALTIIPIPIYLPSQYYAVLSTTGTITQNISGQMTMPV